MLSNFISSIPFLTLMAFVTAMVTYNMVKFQSGFSHITYACLDLLFSIAVVESCMMVIASLVPNFMMGIITGSGFIVRFNILNTECCTKFTSFTHYHRVL